MNGKSKPGKNKPGKNKPGKSKPGKSKPVKNKSGKRKIIWITRTAVFTALLIAMQTATAPMGNIIITGAVVNLLLIVSVMTCGLACGLSVATVSPVMAKFLGIGPFWSIIPFLIAGNMTLVLLWYFVGNRNMGNKYTAYIAALISAAVAKFLVLYIGIVRIAIPIFLSLPEQQAAVVSNMFSIRQLVTAIAGGLTATALLPTLKKAIRERRE